MPGVEKISGERVAGKLRWLYVRMTDAGTDDEMTDALIRTFHEAVPPFALQENHEYYIVSADGYEQLVVKLLWDVPMNPDTVSIAGYARVSLGKDWKARASGCLARLLETVYPKLVESAKRTVEAKAINDRSRRVFEELSEILPVGYRLSSEIKLDEDVADFRFEVL